MLTLIDGNYYLWRAFSVAVRTRDPAYVERNVLTLFLTMVVNDLVLTKATHVAVTFDAPDCWRLGIYKKYKANRRKPADPIYVTHPRHPKPVKVEITAGSLVKKAKALVKAAGLFVMHKKTMESDDLLGSLVNHFEDRTLITVSTRDKDMAGLVSNRVVLYWPQEKKYLGPKDVKNHFGVQPFQIRDYLALMGDKVDNIPGVPGVAAKTAAAMLGDGTLKQRLAKSAKLRAKLKPHISRIAMAQKLTTLKILDLRGLALDDLVPQPEDKQALIKAVWAPPKQLSQLRAVAQASKYSGLFKRN